MKTCVSAGLLLFGSVCFAQVPLDRGSPNQAAYPESESAAAWQALAACCMRKALKDHTVDKDPTLNARVDTVMAAVGAAAAAIDVRFANSSWTSILIEDFGHGAVAFPGETILVDATFVRTLQLSDDELALIFSHEAAHVLAGHASAKLSFMAEFLGKEKLPTARKALLEFLADDSYAAVFRPTARLQEREADTVGAAILFASGYDSQRALKLFDKLAERETREHEWAPDFHDAANVRKQIVSGALAELQQVHARRGSEPR